MRGEDLEKKFGVVLFDQDQDPGAGWCAVALPGGRTSTARRINGPNELANDTIWWTNIGYEMFFKGTEVWRNPTLRHDKYLVVSPQDVLKEWGYDPAGVEPHFVTSFCASIFDRIMRMAWQLLSDVNPKLRIDQAFVGKTLREDLRPLLPELDYPKLEAAESMTSGVAWAEFTGTGARGPKGGKWITLRKPRLSYAMTMLQTPVPQGPYEHLSRMDLRQKGPDRVAYIAGLETPCMVEVTVRSMQPEVAPIYGFGAAIDKDKRVNRSWVAQPEFVLLNTFAEIDVRSAWVGEKNWALVPAMNEAVRSFLSDKHTNYSWSAGVLAETLWRAVALGEDKAKAGPLRTGEQRAQTSWQGLWLRASDKCEMFRAGMRLTELGYAVLSYGLGWVRCMVAEEEVAQLIKDGLLLGLVPHPVDVPRAAFPSNRPIPWDQANDPKSRLYAQFSVTGNQNMLWNLDRTPLIEPTQRDAYIRALNDRNRQAAG